MRRRLRAAAARLAAALLATLISAVLGIVSGYFGGKLDLFLQRFVDGTPWAHLDIAGVAWGKKDTGTVPKGGTGFGVRLLDRFVADNYESA